MIKLKPIFLEYTLNAFPTSSQLAARGQRSSITTKLPGLIDRQYSEVVGRSSSYSTSISGNFSCHYLDQKLFQ